MIRTLFKFYSICNKINYYFIQICTQIYLYSNIYSIYWKIIIFLLLDIFINTLLTERIRSSFIVRTFLTSDKFII